VPKSFTKEEKKLLDELSKLDSFKPKPNAKEKSFFEKMKNMFS
jgi:molecular chaperone DnaJ